MMENLLPRKIETAEQLKAFNPYLLADDGDYDEADYEGVNEVSQNFFINLIHFVPFREYLIWHMTFLTQEAKDGDLF